MLLKDENSRTNAVVQRLQALLCFKQSVQLTTAIDTSFVTVQKLISTQAVAGVVDDVQ